jgi:hypothetical protein
MNRALLLAACTIVCSLFVLSCGGAQSLDPSDQNFTSDRATLLTFDFDGQLVTSQAANPAGQIRAQLMYTVGHLNGEASVSRLDKLALSKVATSPLPGGLVRIAYHAKLPVAWGSKTNLPTSYALTLPRRVDAAGQLAFLHSYAPACTEQDGHDVTVDNFWFHYRPRGNGCSLAAADVIAATATAAPSLLNTSSKYTEYHRVWEDGRFTAVAVFGKYAETGNGEDDAGIAAYDAFVAALQQELPGAAITPAGATGYPATDITFRTATASITVLLVNSMGTVTAAWDKRFAELTPNADLILYNGHAGLGANVRLLSQKGQFFPGKYQILFLDGCDTFAYADDTLAKRRAPLNPDDIAGTKYLDIISNAMPAYFSSMPEASMALVHALLHPEAPQTYPAIFRGVNPDHVVVATGEEDNVFQPGTRVSPQWHALSEEGFVAHNESVAYSAGVLQPGNYVFAMTGNPAVAGGDADLHIQVGTAARVKCPSYVGNSNERCKVSLTAPAKVALTVTGAAAGVESHFMLDGFSR